PLVGRGGARAELVRAAVNVGAPLAREGRHRPNDRLRDLRGRRAVEVGERPSPDALPQRREVGADAPDVERLDRHRRNYSAHGIQLCRSSGYAGQAAADTLAGSAVVKHWQEMAQILDRAIRLGREGKATALAMVTAIRGSAYRRPGAKLLVDGDN